jgi:hypothetical protein
MFCLFSLQWRGVFSSLYLQMKNKGNKISIASHKEISIITNSIHETGQSKISLVERSLFQDVSYNKTKLHPNNYKEIKNNWKTSREG